MNRKRRTKLLSMPQPTLSEGQAVALFAEWLAKKVREGRQGKPLIRLNLREGGLISGLQVAETPPVFETLPLLEKILGEAQLDSRVRTGVDSRAEGK